MIYVVECCGTSLANVFNYSFVSLRNVGILALLIIIQAANTIYDMFFSSLDSEEVCSSFTFITAVMTIAMTSVLICGLMIAIHMTNRRMKKHRIQLSMHLLHANKALHDSLFSGTASDEGPGMMPMKGEHGMGQNKMKSKTMMERKHQRRMFSHSPAPTEPGHGQQQQQQQQQQQEKEETISQLQECIESANAVVQTVVEFDDVQPLKIMNMHVEKEYIFTVLSSMFLYGVVLYNYCDEGLQFLS